MACTLVQQANRVPRLPSIESCLPRGTAVKALEAESGAAAANVPIWVLEQVCDTCVCHGVL